MQDLNKNLLRFHQREELKNEVSQSEKMLNHAKPEEKGVILAGLNRTKKQLETQSPVPLTGKEKDTLSALEKKLRAKITQNMPTDEIMRKNPPGAVDWSTRWERANKKAIRMWKNIRIQLNPDNSDRDLSNVDILRPSGATERGVRADAQIPGLMTYSNIPEENWPFETPQTTALAQAQKHYDESEALKDVDSVVAELDSIEATYAEEEVPEKKKELSVEEHARLVSQLAKGREVLAQKRAERKQIEEELAKADTV